MTDTVSVQRLVALERQFHELKEQSGEMRSRAEAIAAQLALRQKECEEQKERNEGLVQQVHEMQEVENRNDELEFELRKVEGDRDFHRKYHVDAKKTEHHRLATEFSLNSLKHELNFKREEAESLKRWLAELNAQLEDLASFIQKPVADPKYDPQAEQIYSQKVVEMEAVLRKLKERNSALQSSAVSRRPTAESHSSGFRPDQSKVLVAENEVLRQKVESMKKENAVFKHEVDKIRQARAAATPQPASVQTPPAKFSAQDQAILDKYAAEIDVLRRENAKLAEESGPVMREFSDIHAPDVASRLQVAKQEKAQLEEEIERLMQEIGFKDKEIESLRQDGAVGNPGVMGKLVEANKRMLVDIARMHEQIRRFESFSRDSLLNSFNN